MPESVPEDVLVEFCAACVAVVKYFPLKSPEPKEDASPDDAAASDVDPEFVNITYSAASRALVSAVLTCENME